MTVTTSSATPANPAAGPGDSRPVPDPTVLTTQHVSREVSCLREIIETRLDDMDKAIIVLSLWRDSLPERWREDDRHLQKLLETRFNGMDKAIELIQKSADKVPSDVDLAIGRLKDLHEEKLNGLENFVEEKFRGVATQFSERDKRTEQLSIADKTAIAAALQAQKEAAGATQESNSVALMKMETNFSKLIEQQTTMLQTLTRNSDDKIADMKGRIDRGEGKSAISDPTTQEHVRILSAQVSNLIMSRDTATGRGAGMQAAWAVVLGAGALIVSIIGATIKLIV